MQKCHKCGNIIDDSEVEINEQRKKWYDDTQKELENYFKEVGYYKATGKRYEDLMRAKYESENFYFFKCTKCGNIFESRYKEIQLFDDWKKEILDEDSRGIGRHHSYITQYACPNCSSMAIEGYPYDEDIWLCLNCDWTGKYEKLVPTSSSQHPYNKRRN